MACCALAAYLFGCVLRGIGRVRGTAAPRQDAATFAPPATRPGPRTTEVTVDGAFVR
jgi:hypothetical protein